MTMYKDEDQSYSESVPNIDISSFDGIPKLRYKEMSGRTLNGRVVTTASPDECPSYVNDTNLSFLCDRLESVGMEECYDRVEMFNEFQPTYEQDAGTGGETGAQQGDMGVFNQDKDGDTCLHTGIILQETTFALSCINVALSSASLSIKNFLLQTPLHLSVLTNQITLVRRLVVGGSDVESRDKNGNTPLHIACKNGYLKCVKALMEPVRYPEIQQNRYKMQYQRIPQNLDILNYEGNDCLHLAASNEHLEIVELLIDKGADLNSKEGKTGRTILHNACLDGNLNLVKLLLQHHSCNINASAYDDLTPFDFARARGHLDIIMVLATAGARYGDEEDDMG